MFFLGFRLLGSSAMGSRRQGKGGWAGMHLLLFPEVCVPPQANPLRNGSYLQFLHRHTSHVPSQIFPVYTLQPPCQSTCTPWNAFQ